MMVAQTLKAIDIDGDLRDEVYRTLDGSNSEAGHVKLDVDEVKEGC